MIRINLLPPEERASIKAINTNAILLSCGIVLIALMLFTGVYLRLQIMWENDKLVGYQEAVANMSHYRTAIARMEKQMKALEKQTEPLTNQMQEIGTSAHIEQLFRRVSYSATRGNVWLQDLTLLKDGSLPITGYAVDFSDLDRFLTAFGKDPFRVQMGSQGWEARAGVRLVAFSAKVGLPYGGDQPQ